VKLDRIDDLASELSSNLLKSMVLPGGLLGWLSRPLTERIRKHQKSQSSATDQDRDRALSLKSRASCGPVVLLGGYPVPDEAVVEIIHLSGGRSAKVAVIPVAAEDQKVAGAAAMRLLTRFGMRQTQIIEIQSRAQADTPEFAAGLAGFDAILLCGDNPVLGYQRLQGTVSALAIQALSLTGKLVIGLSGGAGLLAEKTVVADNENEYPKPGLGIVSGILVQAGELPKANFSRLTRALGRVDSLTLAASVDAGTALVLKSGEAKVLGDASVTFLDIEAGAAPDLARPAREAKVLVLGAGCGLSLVTRRLTSHAKDGNSSQAIAQLP